MVIESLIHWTHDNQENTITVSHIDSNTTETQTMNPLRKFTAVLAAMLLAGSALAQTGSGKPVTLMVPYPAGGPSDTLARAMQLPFSKALGKQVIIENLGGAGGSIGAQKVLNAPADGQNIFLGSANEVMLAPLANATVKYKSEDFRLVHPIADSVIVLLTRKDLPVNNMDELIALARKSADKPLTYGSVGVGSLYHFILEDVQHRKSVRFLHAPYKGNAPLIQDVGGGQVDFAVLVYNAAMGAMAKEGRIKIIGQFGDKRADLLKQVPMVSEGQELKNYVFGISSGFYVPKNTPEPAVQQIHKAVVTALSDKALRESLEAQSNTAALPMSLEEAAKVFAADIARYQSIAKSINLQPQ